MSLKQRLNEDMKTAMRAKDSLRLSVIRLVNAAIKQFEVDERVEADDQRVVALIGKMIKQRKDSADIYARAKRADLAEKEQAEMAVLQTYLPAMMSPAQIEAAVAAAVAETAAAGMADMGRVMVLLKTRLAGQADMALVSQALKAALGR